MNKTRLFALACFITAVPLAYITNASAGAVFKTIDEEGNVTFTDNPPADGDSREIKIRPINTQAATAPPPPAEVLTGPTDKTAEEKQEEVKEVRYTASLITRPLDQSTVPPGQTEVVIQLGLTPSLQTGHTIKFFHNERRVGPATTNSRLTLTDLVRGEHQVRAQVFGADGKRKAETQTVTFYVKRYHPKKGKN